MNRLSLALALLCAAAPTCAQSPVAPPAPRPDTLGFAGTARDGPEGPSARWQHDPGVGLVYHAGDLRVAVWGFAERLFDPGGPDSWRRVRQGAEVDFPRLTRGPARGIRPAFVYEVDLTNNDFFRSGTRARVFENLFVAAQDADDPGRFRVLVGENTHILSREDNLPTGDLPTINRSLVLEEHGSVNSFGTQFGVQAQRALSSRYTLALSAQDDRGSLNTDAPRWRIGNSLAAKLAALVLDDRARSRRLTAGFGVDLTRSIRDRSFTLASAIGAEPLGAVKADGDKLSAEADVAYTSRVGARPVAIEAEGLVSTFSGIEETATGGAGTRVGGGYVLAQMSAFANSRVGSLDPFLRYDAVWLGQEAVAEVALQQAWRVGANYNLPHTSGLVNLHLEYAWNSVRGPAAIVPEDRDFGEVRLGLRVNAARYTRY